MFSAPPVDYSQAMRSVFAGQDPKRIIWQPRLEFWYAVNKKRGMLPEHLKDATLEDVYDYCHASIRYFSNPLQVRYKNTRIREKMLDEKNLERIFETAQGELREIIHYDEWGISAYNFEYLLKKPEDLAIYRAILEDEEWVWDAATLAQDQARIGARGLLMFYARRSPLQSLFIETMGFENAVWMMTDHPEMIQSYMELRAHYDDAMYQTICANHPPLFNFGENIDANMDPPSYWRKHLLPYYQKRTRQLHAAGIYTSIHIDGAMKPLLKDIRDCPTTGIEACTPLPQGDVSSQEIKAALGEKVMLDGIPAIYFLPMYPLETLKECVKEQIDVFYPHLVLGVSDEPPPDSDIERIRLVGELVQEFNL
jgi:hypothetical protein